MDILELFNQYIRSELLIITPVLYVIAKAVSNSKTDDKQIPWILMGVSVVLAGLYIFATSDISTISQFSMALFSTLVQGILLSGAAVFGGILGNLMMPKK